MDRFPEFPVDIAQTIISIAIMNDNTVETASVLSHVSSLVQSWFVIEVCGSFGLWNQVKLADPLLFQHITFKFKKQSIRYITSKSSRLIRIHSFVRGISFLEAMNLDRFGTIVSLHPNVKFFRCVHPLPSGAENLSVPSLTHLVAFTNWGEEAPLSGTLYTNLTHLDIRRYETEVIPPLAKDLSQIPSLKAVSISGGRFEEFKYDAVLAAIFSLPTTLDLIAIWTLQWDELKYSDMDVGTRCLVTGELDARVVVVNWGANSKSAPNCVTMEHSTELSLWECFGSLEMEVWVRAATFQVKRKACMERRSPSP